FLFLLLLSSLAPAPPPGCRSPQSRTFAPACCTLGRNEVVAVGVPCMRYLPRCPGTYPKTKVDVESPAILPPPTSRGKERMRSKAPGPTPSQSQLTSAQKGTKDYTLLSTLSSH
ncbi:hypothetical protein JMJ77_0005501, partial [Colletotrichum scovillei]